MSCLRRAAVLLLAALLVPALPLAAAPPEDGPERLVVHVDRPPGLAKGQAWHGAEVAHTDEVLGFVAVEAPNGRAFRAEAARDGRVRSVEPDVPVQVQATPSDPRFSSQYGPQLADVPRAWNTTLGDSDAAVCILDTGVRGTHEEFVGPRWKGGWDFVNGDADPNDDQGHGTHVAGTAAGAVDNGRGIAGIANVDLYAAKVLDHSGSGWLSTVASGVRWCADQAPRMVLSLSLGGGYSTALHDAVKYAQGKGALIVAAAGNDGPCSDCINYPAAHPEALAVTCVDAAKAACWFTSTGVQAFLAAPGKGIVAPSYTGDGNYTTKSGTSMSTPHVSGVAALVWSHVTTLTAGELRTYLRCAAADLGPTGWDSTYGWGLVDAERTLRAAKAGNCDVPADPPPRPDLRAVDLTLPSAASAGEAVTFRATVRNEGDATAPTFRVKFYLDGVGVGERAVTGLAPGATATVTSPAVASAAGAHDLRVLADAWRVVEEDDEADNALNASYEVAARPDLVVDSLQGGPAFTATVRNAGGTAAGTFRVKFYVDGAVLGERAVLGLAPGATATVTSAAWSGPAGTHEVRAMADAWRVVAEGNEGNNVATWSYAST